MKKLGCSLGVDVFGIQLNIQRCFSFLTPLPNTLTLSYGEDILEERDKGLKRKLKGEGEINCHQFGERAPRL